MEEASREETSRELINQIVALIKPLAVEYRALTGRSLGITGELAEHEASRLLNLQLAPARTEGYDAVREVPGGIERI